MKQSAQRRVEQAKHKQHMRDDWNGLIDDLVQDGQDKGLFDNLRGKGKPLNLSKNHFEAGQELANTIMKDNEVTPAWIMERNDILAAQEMLRQEIGRKWDWHQAEFAAAADVPAKGCLTISWDDFCLAWQEQISALNKRIVTYNLKRPSDNLEIFKISFEEELQRADAPRWLR
ncbi:MAG: DUF1992 domain-containing protein [Chloroflexi bacterium]|nr:DUF1992 domain-containing protein [Chloroflexota bacterium]